MTGLPHRLVCEFMYADDRQAGIVYGSVHQEMGEIPGDRAMADVSHEGRVLRVEIEADDLVALRAAMNTWVGLVGVAERVLEAP